MLWTIYNINIIHNAGTFSMSDVTADVMDDECLFGKGIYIFVKHITHKTWHISLFSLL